MYYTVRLVAIRLPVTAADTTPIPILSATHMSLEQILIGFYQIAIKVEKVYEI